MSEHDEDVDDQSDDNDQNDDDDNDQDDDDDQNDDDDEQTDSDNNDDDFIHPKFSTHDDEDKEKKAHGMNVEGDEMDDEGENEEDDANELYKDVNINLEGQNIQMADVQTTQVIKDTHVTLTLVNLEVDKYLDHRMNEAVKVVVQLQSDRLKDEDQAENEDFLNKLDENIQKIIKEQVKEQVKAQVSKILPKIEKTVNEQLKAEVLTRSSNSSKTSHAIAANLSELELKKILIEKMESNKSIHRSDE
nr:hypothetical protein [Tanacetum cinerariifolium]